MKNRFFGRSKIDVDDPLKYKYLDPIWELLRGTPEQGITWEDVGKQTGLDPGITVPLVQELSRIYMAKMRKVLFVGDLRTINSDTFWDENLKDSWLFDKCMLMCVKIDTGIKNEMFDTNPYMQAFKEKWLVSKGM